MFHSPFLSLLRKWEQADVCLHRRQGKKQTTPQSQHRGTIKIKFTVCGTCSRAELTVSILIICRAFGGSASCMAERRQHWYTQNDARFFSTYYTNHPLWARGCCLPVRLLWVRAPWASRGWDLPPRMGSDDSRHPESRQWEHGAPAPRCGRQVPRKVRQ